MERRLAAILVADVVGYTRLMEQDEDGTMAALTERRKAVWEPLLAKYRGRIIRTKGDGTLAEFASAVDAVQCAVDVQKAMKEANTKVSDDRAIVLRIGLNLGDVMVEDGDLYGDGVNVAARLEAMADPGEIKRLTSNALDSSLVLNSSSKVVFVRLVAESGSRLS